MNFSQTLATALDPTRILRAQGLNPDPWQRDLLLGNARQVLLCCSRGAGKTRTTSALALHQALFAPGSLVLIVSRAQRQSLELFRYVKQGYAALGRPLPTRKETETQLEFANGSRIICLPGKEETIRAYQGVRLLIVDEAARVPDALYHSVRPMLAVSRGRLMCLSTPFGQRGFFWKEWQRQGRGSRVESRAPESGSALDSPLSALDSAWQRIRIPWQQCPRIAADFIAQELEAMGEAWVRQEYECEFTALEGLVYPDFDQCLIDTWPFQSRESRVESREPERGLAHDSRLSALDYVGGIDFGWRNPFAAVSGVLDRDGVLWINHERYRTMTPLQDHASVLLAHGRVAHSVIWYADPSGATEIAELRRAGLTVRKGINDIRPGIAAVSARIRSGRLKVLRSACPNLIREARLYRYPKPDERAVLGENPIDEHNHALAALRYLVSRIDARSMARHCETSKSEGPHDDEDHWVPLG